jgi:hypothetical protein
MDAERHHGDPRGQSQDTSDDSIHPFDSRLRGAGAAEFR